MLQQHITVLDLSSVRQYVTDDHLERLRKCTRVRKVNLSNCNNTSSSAIHKLLLLCASNGTTLEAVHLANCHLSTETLGVLGQAHGLRTLDLTNTMIRPCASMDTPHHLETMLGHSAQPLMLEVLNLSYCSWVDDETLQNITNGLPHLRRLELCWCHRVSDATILYLVQNLTRLEMIGLRHLVTVGLQMAWTLLNANSNLTTIDFSNRFKSFRLIRNDSVVTMEDHL
ncbi:hypothetical protein DFQ28_010258 [Apophysomyces sp. BC1034]|nr:hypothetical protein DFQ28_010258 [Apophysomyces sp. BC1034]